MAGNVAHYLTLHTGQGAGREILTECLVAPDEVFNPDEVFAPDEPAVRVTVNRTRPPARTLATLDLTVDEVDILIRQLTAARKAAV